MSRSNTKPMNPRTARTPSQDEQHYVIAQGAPKHYVDGYGLVGGGAIVTLATGVTPGKYMMEVAPEDAAKAQASESDAQRLAVLAAAKIKANANSGDVKRKQAADEKSREQANAEAQRLAQAEADAIEKARKADENAEKEASKAAAAEKRANDLEEELEKARRDLAAAQSQLQKHEASSSSAKSGK